MPHYLSLLDPKKNVPDNIDALFFSAGAELEGEFQRLFKSLFKSADTYMEIIRLLSARREGFTRKEISEKLDVSDNGALGDMLEDLEHCDFIRRYNNGRHQNGGIYQLMDFFSMFHYRYGNRKVTDEHFWRNHLGTPEQNNWYGLTFERVCMWHIGQIIRGLHLDTIAHEYYSWRSRESNPAVQIDMIIDRADGIVTVCEMKYSKDDYRVTEAEYRKIVRRMEVFGQETGHVDALPAASGRPAAVGEEQEEQRGGDHFPALPSQPQQQDPLQRTAEARAVGVRPLHVDEPEENSDLRMEIRTKTVNKHLSRRFGGTAAVPGPCGNFFHGSGNPVLAPVIPSCQDGLLKKWYFLKGTH